MSHRLQRDHVSMSVDESNPTMPHLLAREIAQRVLHGQLRPGMSLREIPLAAEYAVSRGSIREALRILERDGVVQIEARRGASVTRLSTDQLIEIYQVRAVLLGLAMELFCARFGGAELAWLRDRFGDMQQTASEDPSIGVARHAAISADMALFIVGRSGNARLERLLTQMSLQIARYTHIGLSSPERLAQSRQTWRSIIGAIEQRDAESAERLGRKLVKDTLRFALAQVAHLEPTTAG